MSLNSSHDFLQAIDAHGIDISMRCSLAWAELFIATAMLFRPGGPKMALYDTNETDIKIVRDYIMGFPEPRAGGIKVKIQ